MKPSGAGPSEQTDGSTSSDDDVVFVLVENIERLLAERHVGPVEAWDAHTNALSVLEEQLLALPMTQLRVATDALLSLLYQMVEQGGV